MRTCALCREELPPNKPYRYTGHNECSDCIWSTDTKILETLIAKAGQEFIKKGITDRTRIKYIAEAIRAAGYARHE